MKQVVLWQRLEGAAVYLAATWLYFHNGFPLVWYVVLLFSFDVSMIGYLFGNKIGAVVYNLGHSLVFPSLLAVVYLVSPSNPLLGLICLWFAHIGVDRALGFGLKLTSGFKHTHLGNIG